MPGEDGAGVGVRVNGVRDTLGVGGDVDNDEEDKRGRHMWSGYARETGAESKIIGSCWNRSAWMGITVFKALANQ